MLWDPKKDVDLREPTLKGLAYLLRHKELWPKGFEWDYGHCRTCAVGLTNKYWSLVPAHSLTSKPVRLALGLTNEESCDLFFNSSNGRTPEILADTIDKLIDFKQSHTEVPE